MHFKSCIPILIIFTLMGCSQNKADGQVKNKKFQLMLNLMLSKKTPVISVLAAHKNEGKYVFVDSREKKEYDVSHIKNARFIGYDSFDVSSMAGIEKNAPVIVYCSVGKRSENITNKLEAAGFINVRNMYGGIFEWVNDGYPVYNNNGQVTDEIHAYNKTWGIWLNKGKKVY